MATPTLGMAGLAEYVAWLTLMIAFGSLLLALFLTVLSLARRSWILGLVALALLAGFGVCFAPWTSLAPYPGGDSDVIYWMSLWRWLTVFWAFLVVGACAAVVMACAARHQRADPQP